MMRGQAALALLALALLAGCAQAAKHKYEVHEKVTLWANKVSPIAHHAAAWRAGRRGSCAGRGMPAVGPAWPPLLAPTAR